MTTPPTPAGADVPCKNCCGAGYFGQNSDCRVCGGTGRVPAGADREKCDHCAHGEPILTDAIGFIEKGARVHLLDYAPRVDGSQRVARCLVSPAPSREPAKKSVQTVNPRGWEKPIDPAPAPGCKCDPPDHCNKNCVCRGNHFNAPDPAPGERDCGCKIEFVFDRWKLQPTFCRYVQVRTALSAAQQRIEVLTRERDDFEFAFSAITKDGEYIGARAEVASLTAERDGLREALQGSRAMLQLHHEAGRARRLLETWICELCKESEIFETIDAALAAPPDGKTGRG